MKKLIKSLLVLPALLLTTTLFAGTPPDAGTVPNIDEHLLKAFAAAYPTAEKISWSEETGGHYVVHFLDHNVRAVMEYDAEARMVHCIRYYSDPAMLPQNISWEWHRRFPEKTLFGIIEVSDGETTAWFLKGQDARHWVTVRAFADGEMQVVEKMKKQS